MSYRRSLRARRELFTVRALLALLALAAAASLGCGPGATPRAAPAPSLAAAAAPPPPHRVIVISLDGADTQTLHVLYRQGKLRAGGFASFFRDGECASLIPVDPTLTAVNHVSLATGFTPAATGIVGNQFHPAGAPFTQRVSGFDATVGTETLWEAARRQGRRVGILTWPSADGQSERRRGDWGLIYNNTAEHDAQLVTLARSDWQPPGTGTGGAPPPNLAARVPLTGDPPGAPARFLTLFADDARGTLVAAAGQPGGPPGPATAPLRAGEWGRVSWPLPPGAGGGRAAAWVKVLEIAPDLARTRLYLGGLYRTPAYPDAFAVAVADAGLDWPGAPDDADLMATWQGQAGIDLDTWTEQAQHMASFMGDALRLGAAHGGWDLLMGYIPVIDEAGHRLLLVDPRQEGFTAARRDELAGARLRVWQAVDAELAKLLAGLDLAHTTVVVVSDHGMAPVHTAIDPGAPLAELGLLRKESSKDAAATASPTTAANAGPTAYAIPDGGVANVYLDAGGDTAAAARILADLAARYTAWRPTAAGEPPIERVLTRAEAAALGLDHPNSGDLILFAREGYVFRRLAGGKAAVPAPLYGAHGYLNTHPDMRASYLAIGAGVTPRRDRTLKATDVAPQVAVWLGIEPPRRLE